MTFEDLRKSNSARHREWARGESLPLSFRGLELGGEAGEACNEIKKIEHTTRVGWRQGRLAGLGQRIGGRHYLRRSDRHGFGNRFGRSGAKQVQPDVRQIRPGNQVSIVVSWTELDLVLLVDDLKLLMPDTRLDLFK